MRKIEVIDYKVSWQEIFNKESSKLYVIFKEENPVVYHIGSTSVKDLKAKPIIDMLMTVKNIEALKKYEDKMDSLNYMAKGENGLPGRRYFEKGGDNRTHHLHVYQTGNPEITRHLAFRDYLQAHSSAAEQYGELKAELARQFPYDVEAYINGKQKLVEQLEEQALRW